jgi:hypothetical protein
MLSFSVKNAQIQIWAIFLHNDTYTRHQHTSHHTRVCVCVVFQLIGDIFYFIFGKVYFFICSSLISSNDDVII